MKKRGLSYLQFQRLQGPCLMTAFSLAASQGNTAHHTARQRTHVCKHMCMYVCVCVCVYFSLLVWLPCPIKPPIAHLSTPPSAPQLTSPLQEFICVKGRKTQGAFLTSTTHVFPVTIRGLSGVVSRGQQQAWGLGHCRHPCNSHGWWSQDSHQEPRIPCAQKANKRHWEKEGERKPSLPHLDLLGTASHETNHS